MSIADSAFSPQSREAQRLPGLDALRAIAAACVVVMHLGAIYQVTPKLLGTAYLAVDFFFLLSGFVMARTYEQRMRTGRIGPGRFLWSRYRRLWPTMAIGGLLSLPFVWRDTRDLALTAQVSLPNFFLLPSAGAAEIFPLNVPAWSIFFELVANLAHGAVLWRLGKRALGLLVFAFLAAVVICGWHFGGLDLGARMETIVGGLARVGFSYGLGILLWRLHGDRAPLAIPPVLAFLAMPVLFTLASLRGFDGWIFDVLFVTVCCPLMLWGGLRARRLERILLAAGSLSFPLYAVHYPVLLAVEAAGIPGRYAPLLALCCAAVVQWLTSRSWQMRKSDPTLQCAV